VTQVMCFAAECTMARQATGSMQVTVRRRDAFCGPRAAQHVLCSAIAGCSMRATTWPMATSPMLMLYCCRQQATKRLQTTVGSIVLYAIEHSQSAG